MNTDRITFGNDGEIEADGVLIAYDEEIRDEIEIDKKAFFYMDDASFDALIERISDTAARYRAKAVATSLTE